MDALIAIRHTRLRADAERRGARPVSGRSRSGSRHSDEQLYARTAQARDRPQSGPLLRVRRVRSARGGDETGPAAGHALRRRHRGPRRRLPEHSAAARRRRRRWNPAGWVGGGGSPPPATRRDSAAVAPDRHQRGAGGPLGWLAGRLSSGGPVAIGTGAGSVAGLMAYVRKRSSWDRSSVPILFGALVTERPAGAVTSRPGPAHRPRLGGWVRWRSPSLPGRHPCPLAEPWTTTTLRCRAGGPRRVDR